MFFIIKKKKKPKLKAVLFMPAVTNFRGIQSCTGQDLKQTAIVDPAL